MTTYIRRHPRTEQVIGGLATVLLISPQFTGPINAAIELLDDLEWCVGGRHTLDEVPFRVWFMFENRTFERVDLNRSEAEIVERIAELFDADQYGVIGIGGRTVPENGPLTGAASGTSPANLHGPCNLDAIRNWVHTSLESVARRKQVEQS